MKKPVIIIAPAGSGKSRHAAALQKTLGCSRVVDGWNRVDPLEDGDLALTNAPIQGMTEYRVMSLEEALAYVQEVA